MKNTYEQWLKIKEQYPDSLLFVRLGDFWETFAEQAEIVAKELDLTLTGRDCGEYGRVKLAGFPFISGDMFKSKLILKNYKVVMLEDIPKIKPLQTWEVK